MKIALAQLNYHIGNFEYNAAKIKACIGKAKKQDVDLIVFSELCVCGYPPRDFLEFGDFILKCEAGIRDISQECQDIAAIVGSPSFNPRPKGKRLFNTAFFLAEGRVQSLHHKSLLPVYDVFDEYRYFEPCRECITAAYQNCRIAVTICEDIWNVEDDHPMYEYYPMADLCGYSPDLIVNISASPFSYNHPEERKRIILQNVRKYKLPVIYVNQVGANTELIFDGGSIVADVCGKIEELKYFDEDFRIVDLASLKSSGDSGEIDKTLTALNQYPEDSLKIQRIHDALVLGIKDYFAKTGFKKAIVGLSGGIDSSVVFALAVKALGKDNVHGLLMPSRFSSAESVEDAEKLVSIHQTSYDRIPIESIRKSYGAVLEPYFHGMKTDITEENIQARIRAALLMAFANKFGYILLNTTNKSESATGYGTLYGDMAGGLSVLGDVYKTGVYALARYLNGEGEMIPRAIIEKAPSAELRPGQKDSDSLPEYAVLDEILYRYIEQRKDTDEIIAEGFDAGIVRKTLNLVNASEYKRCQTPPILRVSHKAFGMGRRMPVAAKYIGS